MASLTHPDRTGNASRRAPPSLLVRLRLNARVWFMKTIVALYVFLKKHTALGARWRPTYTKRYAAQPGIECRIFIPKTYKSGDKPLPLLIDIHGGGFTFGAPIVDDPPNHSFAHRHGFLVVAIGYRLAPVHKFPHAPRDCAALIRAVLDDADLPYDRARVAVCGYSAGGGLALSAPQLHGLHARINAVVVFYGVTDFVSTVPQKLLTRVPDGKRDMLDGMAQAFNYAYVPPDQDRSDPLLSPLYADRDKLPEHLFFLGCEHDLLCRETEAMAEKVGEGEEGPRVAYPDGSGWRKGRVRWELLKGELHGFNTNPSIGREAVRRAERSEKMYADAASWLKDEVFGQPSAIGP